MTNRLTEAAWSPDVTLLDVDASRALLWKVPRDGRHWWVVGLDPELSTPHVRVLRSNDEIVYVSVSVDEVGSALEWPAWLAPDALGSMTIYGPEEGSLAGIGSFMWSYLDSDRLQ